MKDTGEPRKVNIMKQSECYDAEVKNYRARGYSDRYTLKPTLTVARARAILAASKDQMTDFPWNRNPSLTERQAYDILDRAIDGMADADLVHFLAARNIVKLCGKFYKSER